MAVASMPLSPLSISRETSSGSTAIVGNGSPQRRNSSGRNNYRSPSPSTQRFASVATPTFDNRKRRSLTPQQMKKTEKAPTDRKTKIQVCVRLRPVLPSDSRTGVPPTPEEKMKRSSASARHSQIKVKAKSSRRIVKESSRVSTLSSTSYEDVVDTEPAWEMGHNTVGQAAHTNPDSNRNNSYTFDHTFGPMSDTSEIYHETVQDSVLSTMEGYHASVFAYGQTATGKTHTMTGGSGGGKFSENRKGIVQLAINDCFDYIQNQKNETREYLLRVSFMEIYNEVINDLLASPNRSQPLMTTSMKSTPSTPPPPSAIRIFESKNEGVVIRGLKEEIVTCPEQVYTLLAAGERRRQTGATSMNKHSSRSHSIFRLIVESRRRNPRQASQNMRASDTDSIASSTFAPASTSGPVRVSSLSLVDLAGSESVKNTGSSGTRQKEGQYINKSLLTLGHVVYKLADASSKSGAKSGVDTMHIPYRDSKLTRLLQPSLSGNAQICIICNISPLSKHIEESHLTLKFASRAKKIKQNAKINELIDEKTLLENYREEIEDLKLQLKEARESQGNLGENKSIDDEDVEVLTKAVGNLEKLILKTTTADEKKRKQQRREAMSRMRSEPGIPQSISGDTDMRSRDGDTLLNGLNEADDEHTLLNSLSLDDFSAKNRGYKGGSSTSLSKDDRSLGSGSLGDESTILEGKKLANELHRIQRLLGTVLAKKGTVVTPSMSSGSYGVSFRSTQENEVEVERLRAQLHEQAVHTSLRKADSTFLQSQLQQKDVLLKDISQILEAVEKRQVELETDNGRLKREWTRASEALRSKEAETAILEKIIKKREIEIRKLKAESSDA